jgi:hypothetical protein
VLDPCEGCALLDAQWAKLIEANEKLACAKSAAAVIGVLRELWLPLSAERPAASAA